MNNQSVSPQKPGLSGRKVAGYVSVALLFTLLGLLIASNLDLSPHSIAQVATNIAQTGAFPVVEKDGREQSPFVDVVDRVADAVVNVSAKTPDEQAPWWFRGGHYAMSRGSGFFFREDGYILTNNHVIANATEISVKTSSGYDYTATLVGADPESDLAVLRVTPEEKITAIPFGDSEDIQVGDWAIAIGNPFPEQGLDRTVTVGVVSAKERSSLRFGGETPSYQNYIQTDAAINPGNSGGPLLNLKGECIGVNAAITSPTGSSVGIGFAIPINLARAIVPDLIATGQVNRGWLGVYMRNVNERQAKQLGMSAVRGVFIDSVFTGSPADQAGLRQGDVVVKFNNQDVANSSQFSVLVTTVRQGVSIPMEVIRDGDHLTLNTFVGDRNTSLARAPQQLDDHVATDVVLGMEISKFTPQIASEIGGEHVPGLYVWSVYPGTAADVAGITAGSVIMKVGKTSVTTVEELVAAVREEADGSRIPLIVQEPDGAIARKMLRR